MKSKSSGNRCFNCGRECVPATDALGQPYMGCPVCRVAESKPEPQPSPRLPLRHVANEVIDADARYLALAGDIEIARWLVDRCNAPEPSASVARSEVSLLEAMTQLRDRLRAQASNAFLDDWRDLWTDVANELDRLANRGGGA